MPELPCCFAPVLDCEPESCVCASWRRPVAGSAATGAATARAAAAPNITARSRILLLLRRVSPQDNPAVDVGFPRAAKIMDEPMFIFGARFRALRRMNHHSHSAPRLLSERLCADLLCLDVCRFDNGHHFSISAL